MSKNKGSFGKTKSAVELDDEFVSGVGKVAEQLKPHATRIAFAVGGVFVVFGLYAAYDWFQDRAAEKATAQFVAAGEIARAMVVKPGEPKSPLLGEQMKTFPTAKERVEATVRAYAQLRDDHESTGVARMARLAHAGALLEQGNADAALALYREQSEDEDAPALLRSLAFEGVGYALEARARKLNDASQKNAALAEALAAFAKSAPGDKSPLRAHALYHKGRILGQMGKKSEAMAAFREALQADADGALEDEVKNRLASLEASAAPGRGN